MLSDLFFHTFTFSCTFLPVFHIPSCCINWITKALSFIFYHPKGNYTKNTGPEVESQCYFEAIYFMLGRKTLIGTQWQENI